MTLSSTSGGLEVMGVNIAKNDYKKRAATPRKTPNKAAPAPKSKMTSENYTRLYMEQEAAAKAEAQQKAREQQEKANPFEIRRAEAKIADARKVEAFRGRARDLQGQIHGLRQQLGQGEDADRRTQSAIDDLSRELGGIPTIYWT